LSTLSQAVLDFGFMESLLHTIIIDLSRKDTLAKALVPPGNSVSTNLELLRCDRKTRIGQKRKLAITQG